MLKEGLMKHGVKEENIIMVPDETESVAFALEQAKAGDMVTVFVDNIKRTWKQIIYFNKESTSDAETKSEPAPQHISVVDLSMDKSVSEEISNMLKGEIISDERGVRVAMMDEDEDGD